MPGTSTEQVVDKGIRQKSTKEWTHSLTAVPFVRGHRKRVPSDFEKHRRVYTSSNVCYSHEWRVDTASGKTLKKRNACIYGLRSEGVKDILYTNYSDLFRYLKPCFFFQRREFDEEIMKRQMAMKEETKRRKDFTNIKVKLCYIVFFSDLPWVTWGNWISEYIYST